MSVNDPGGGCVVAGAFSFATAFDEANELQDDVLRQVAALVEPAGPAQLARGLTIALRMPTRSRASSVQRLGAAGDRRPVDAGAPPALPDALGRRAADAHRRRREIRVLVRTRSTGDSSWPGSPAFGTRSRATGPCEPCCPFLVLVPILLVITADP